MLVSDAVAQFKQDRRATLKADTLQAYERTLRAMLDFDQPIELVTYDDLLDRYLKLREQSMIYVNHPNRSSKRSTLKISTLHKHVRHTKIFFNWLMDHEMIRHNPARKLKRPKLPRAVPKGIPQSDIQRLMDTAQEMGLREYAIVCLLAGTACRLSGLVNLVLEHVDFENRTVILHEKFDQEREVRLPPRAADALRRYIEEERPRDKGTAVFIGRRGPLTASGIEQILYKVADKAGVSRGNAHAFRHGFVSHALKQGENIKTVQEILGHEDSRTTIMAYGAMATREVMEAHDRIDYLPPLSSGGNTDQSGIVFSPTDYQI